jgi:hypothetical protein
MKETQARYSELAGLDAGAEAKPKQARFAWIAGMLLAALKRFDEAEAALEDARLRAQAVGNEWLESWTLNELSSVRAEQGDVAQAIALAERSIELKRRAAPAWDVAVGLGVLATHCEPVDARRAEQLYLEILSQADAEPESVQPRTLASAYLHAVGSRLKSANLVMRAGWLDSAAGHYGAAARMFGAFAAIQRAEGIELDATSAGKANASIDDLHAVAVARCRDALGDEAFLAELAAGGRIALDEALALAEARVSSDATTE